MQKASPAACFLRGKIYLPVRFRIREKELDGEERESIQKCSVKPVSAGGFMTFQISQVYSGRVASTS
jgi:hypothetical protein